MAWFCWGRVGVVGNAQVLHIDFFPVRTQLATPGLTVLKFCSRWKEQVSHSRRQAVWERRLCGPDDQVCEGMRSSRSGAEGNKADPAVLVASQRPGSPGHTLSSHRTSWRHRRGGGRRTAHTQQSPNVSGTVLRDFQIFNHLKPRFNG